MDRLKDKLVDIKYYIEDHKWVKWVAGIAVGIGLMVVAVNVIGDESGADGEDSGGTQSEQVEESTETNSENETSTELIGVSEETLHILTNPDQYEEDDINRAYHDSLTTFDNQFVEDNVYVESGLSNGVYLYHEKADEEYMEVAELAKEASGLGVPIYFYTPQYDQSIASLSNHTPIVENGEVKVKAVIVRDYKVAEEITELEEVKTYMEGVIDENTK